jgi:rhodanese-related sulfurtransferase
VTPEELQSAGEGVLRIDIRKNPDDRQIPGSIRHDGAELESGDVPFAKDRPVVLYCGSGNSCNRVAATLRDRGYNATALDGGYRAWVDAGLPTEDR